MRNLVSFAVASLLLLPALDVRAERFASGEDAGPGSPTAEVSPDRPVPARPLVTLDTLRNVGDGVNHLDSLFLFRIHFDQIVTGLDEEEVDLVNATTVSTLACTDHDNESPATDSTVCTIRIKAKRDFDGTITATIPENAAHNDADEGNVAPTPLKFKVDNKAPRLRTATLGRTGGTVDTITLRYDEPLSEDNTPGSDRFQIRTLAWPYNDGDTATITETNAIPSGNVRIRGSVVHLLLHPADTIGHGDKIWIDYLAGDPALQDVAPGNKAKALHRQEVQNPRKLTVPGHVRELTATGLSTDTIELTWLSPTDTGGAPLQGYRIEGKKDGQSGYDILRDYNHDPDSLTTEFLHGGLQAGATWHYLVRARNKVGSGSTREDTATTKTDEPSKPLGLSAEADGDTAIDLVWRPPADTGSSDVTGYRIEESSNGTSWTTKESNNADTTYKRTGLSAGSTRHYQVRAINGSGAGPPSDTASATTESRRPGQPLNLSAEADGDTAIALDWDRPTDAGSTPITGYWIEESSNGTSWTNVVRNTGNTKTAYPRTGLSGGTTRHYRVSAINSIGPGPASDTASATTKKKPGPPRALSAKADGTTAIDLVWRPPADTGSSRVTGYRIQESSNGTSWTTRVSNNADTTYRRTGLSPGTTRHYRVYAINSVGEGPASDTAVATTVKGTNPPGPPRNLSATADGTTAIALDWEPPEDSGSSKVTGYKIDVSSNGTSWTTRVANTGDTVPAYRHTGLSPGTTRHYRVFAINTAGGAGTASNTASATTNANLPGRPTDLTATGADSTTIDLSWNEPDDDGGSDITGYRIERSNNGTSGWSTLEETETPATRYSDDTLSPNTTRHYRVSAINGAGTGDPSNVASATTSATVPGAPTGLTATAKDTARIDIAWRTPEEDGGSPITGYRIERSSNGVSWVDLVFDTEDTNTNFSHTTLSPGERQYYRVSARNSAGVGPRSRVAFATTFDVPGPPTDLSATPEGETRIKLDWGPPDDNGGSDVTGYKIQFSDNAGETWQDEVLNTRSKTTSYTDRDLSPGDTIDYRVFAINEWGTGRESSNIARAVTNATTPGPPLNLTAQAADTLITLDWDPPDDDGGSAVTGYRIVFSENGGASYSTLVRDTRRTSTRYIDTGLDPGTTRHYRVAAINSVGLGDSSNVASAKTPPVAPGRPTGLSATAKDSSRIDLEWNEPSDDGGAEITGYRIEVSENDGATWTVLENDTESTATRYAHTGLDPGTTYHYRVSARNEAGPGSPSNPASATTDATVPDPPTNPAAVAESSTRIRLSWRAPSDGGSKITGYKIEYSDDGPSWPGEVILTQSAATQHSLTGLKPGTTYHYRVSAINAEGEGEPSNVDSATTKATTPDPPTDLTATANGSTQIDLEWTAPTEDGGSPITGYRIEVSITGGQTWRPLVDDTETTETTYSHPGLNPATTRHYRVSAINAEGKSDPSNVANATTDPVVPDPPTGLAARANGTSQIDLAWSTPGYNGGAAITGYRVEVSEDNGSTWTVLEEDTESTATQHAHTGLDPGSTRHYRVSAINAAGKGDPSNVANATTDPVVPDPPTGLVATANGTSQIDLEWSAPGYDGGAEITGYRVEVSENDGATWKDLEGDTESTATQHSQTGLDPGTTRHYRISAINAAGAGKPSNVANATTDPVVPDPPTGLVATANGTSRIDLEWSAPSYDGGAEIAGYRIEVSENNGATWKDLERDTESTATQHAHTGLDPGATRHYRVSAINAAGAGKPSNVANATTDPVVPDPPTGLAATANGPARIDLSWTAPRYDGGTEITGYRIEVSANNGATWTVLVGDTESSATQHAHTGLDPASTRHYRVSAINAAGAGDPSNVANATTDPIAPDPPTGLSATANGTSQIDLSWTAPDYDGGARITGYRIEVSANNGSTWTVLEDDTESTTTRYAHTGLDPASTRHYRVSAINVAGVGDPSNRANATTDATVPDPPTALRATADGTDKIDLAWTAPDYDGGATVTGYRIEVSEDAGDSWTTLVANTESDETEYSQTGLRPASTRHYRVSAINRVGSGEPSNVANATTDATVPDPPTDLVATASAPTRIDLTWVAPAYDGGAPVTGYRIEVSEDLATWADLQSSTGSTETTYSDTGARPGATRHYRVSAINRAGTGDPSEIASATTDDPVQRAGRVNEAILPHFAAAATSSTLAAISTRIEAVAARNPLPSQLRAAGLASVVGQLRGGGGLNAAKLLNGTSFVTPLGGAPQEEDNEGFAAAAWGGAEYVNMGRPNDEQVKWDGGMLSLHLGADMRVHRDFLAGMSMSRSSGDYDFTDVTGARHIGGTYEARMNSLSPYLAWLPGRTGVAVWVAGSFGWGEVAVDDSIGGRRQSDARTTTGALGASRILVSNGPSALRFRAEGWFSRVKLDGGEGMDSLTMDMERGRAVLEWSQAHEFRSGDEVTILLEGGARFGDGEGTDGAGMELGGGVRYSSPAVGLTMEGRGRMLATGADGYEEWGVSGLIQVDPQAGAGLSMRLVPTWGETASGVQELWERGVGGRGHALADTRKGRLNAEVEYGLAGFHGRPYGRAHLVDGGARAFGTGMRYEVSQVFNLQIEGTRTENLDAPASHGLALKGHWRF